MTTIQRARSRRSKLRRVELLTSAERMDLELGAPPAFPSEAARREAWRTHRDAILDDYAAWPGTHGVRPDAFWAYDVADAALRSADESAADIDDQMAAIEDLDRRRLRYLTAHGLLSTGEKATLVVDPRRRDVLLAGFRGRNGSPAA